MPAQDPISGGRIRRLLLNINVCNALQLALQAVVEGLGVVLVLGGVVRTLKEILFTLDRREIMLAVGYRREVGVFRLSVASSG
jgi:hypothetical protein